MAIFTLNDAIPWVVGGLGLLVGYHFLMGRREQPPLAAQANTVDFPDFPRVGIDNPYQVAEGDPQFEFPHPYNHPVIPRYVGAPAYFQNSVQLDHTHYESGIWYDKQIPPLHVKVSSNLPEPNVYSHHKMYFENEAEPSPMDMGILTNTI